MCDTCYDYLSVVRLSEKFDSGMSNPFRITSMALESNTLVTDLVGSVLRSSIDEGKLTPTPEDEGDDMDIDSSGAAAAAVSSECKTPEKSADATAASAAVSSSSDVTPKQNKGAVRISRKTSMREQLTATWEELRRTDEEILSLKARLDICKQKRLELDRYCRDILKTKDMETSIDQLLRLHNVESPPKLPISSE